MCSTDQNSFGLGSVVWALYIRNNFAEKNTGLVKKVTITASITSPWSPFVRCPNYNKPKVKFMHSCNQKNTTANNSQAEDTTAHQPNVFLTETKRVLNINV
jgi:hypothetical protein